MSDETLFQDKAYEIIRETQIKIQSDYVMSSTLDEIMNQDHIKTFNKDFISRNIEMKHYYARILFMTESFKSNKIPFTNKNAFFITKSESDILKIHPSFDPTFCEIFSQKLISIEKKGFLNQKLIDIITFSIIPSFYSMFLEKNSFDSFCDLIKIMASEKTDLRYQLSRSIFVSPLFLIFIRKVMQSILQSIYSNDSSSISIDTIKKALIQSFREKVRFIPSYVNTFFEKVTDTYNFLKESLFKPLVSNPFLFVVVDFNVINKERMYNFIKVLQTIFDDEFIDEIAKIINENTNSEKSIIDSLSTEIEKARSQTEIKIIDSIDQLTIDIINRALANEENQNFDDVFDLLKNTEYKIYQAIFAEMNEELNEEEEQSFLVKTNFNFIASKNQWIYMRKLLKYSQPLPKVNTLPHEVLEKESFLQIVRKYIISTIDLNNKVDAEISLEMIRTDLKSAYFKTIEGFNAKMEELIFSHTEQEDVAQLLNKFSKDLSYLKEKIQIASDLINERFVIHLFELYNFDKPSLKRAITIVQNPFENLQRFNKYIETESEKAINLFGTPDPKINKEKDKIVSTYRKILCGKFYHNFDFYSYLAMRPDLRKFDDIFHDVCLSQLKIIFMDKNAYENVYKIRKAVKNMSVFNDVLTAFNNAFEMNGDPVLKYNAINQCYIEIIDEMKKYSRKDGDDYILPSSIYFFSFANPPYFISNLVFLYEYVECFVDENSISNFFRYILMAFKCIVMDSPILYKKYPLFKLVRTKNINIELIITGNDPLFIASIYKKISLVINDNEPDFNGNDVTKIAEKIDKSKGIQFVEGSSKLNGEDLQNYINFYIRMGVDIQLSKPDNEYKGRIAIYALNKPIKIFKPNNYKNFINSNNITKKMIIVPNDFDSLSESNIAVFKENDFIEQLFRILKQNVQ